MAEDTQQKGTILVVDDDPAIRISLKTLLRRAGYRPVVARRHGRGLSMP